MSHLTEITRRSSLLAVWGTAILAVALYDFVAHPGQPLPAELGMAFGGLVGYIARGIQTKP